MKNVNWNEVQDEIRRPVPGGYAAKITDVVDNEDKEYLLIRWEFAEGEFKGCNQETFEAFGFWPISFVKSYKQKALRFFKGFKNAVEESNRNYTFDCMNPAGLVGKFVGVVLGEEEYLDKEGNLKTRLYVDQVRSGKAIRDNDYKIPDLKKLPVGSSASASIYAATANNYSVLTDDDAELPF